MERNSRAVRSENQDRLASLAFYRNARINVRGDARRMSDAFDLVFGSEDVLRAPVSLKSRILF
jgi:hypothetical protein